jgi:hypothetical protein
MYPTRDLLVLSTDDNNLTLNDQKFKLIFDLKSKIFTDGDIVIKVAKDDRDVKREYKMYNFINDTGCDFIVEILKLKELTINGLTRSILFLKYYPSTLANIPTMV